MVLHSQTQNSQRPAGWVLFPIYKSRKCNSQNVSALPKVYGSVETSSQVSCSLPKDSLYEKGLCYLDGMIIIGEIWQGWAARDGKKAIQPSLAGAQIQLNIIRKKVIEFVHFSSLPALVLPLGTGTGLRPRLLLWARDASAVCSPRRWRPAGGCSSKQMGELINALGTAPGSPKPWERRWLKGYLYRPQIIQLSP